MLRTLPFARPSGSDERPAPAGVAQAVGLPQTGLTCEHRTVSRDGRIMCKKIVEGQAEVSPNVCRQCPYSAVKCQHLRFSLRLSSPSPLVVRFNGRTELWDDGPAELRFDRAACAARVMPIHSPQACAECALRQAACPTGPALVLTDSVRRGTLPDTGPSGRCRVQEGEVGLAAAPAGSGRVVAFPGREVLERREEGKVLERREEGEAVAATG